MTEVHGSEEAVAALFAALAQAREAATLVRKASQSNLGAYASSEHIMVVARKALVDTGISVTPLDCGNSVIGETVVLQRGYLVAHTGGAWYRGAMSWPVLARPDAAKGTGSSETMAFAYYLRTLLMMPRMAADDMDNPGIQATMAASRRKVTPAVPIEGMTAPPIGPTPPPEEFDAEESARLDAEVAAGERQGLFDE